MDGVQTPLVLFAERRFIKMKKKGVAVLALCLLECILVCGCASRENSGSEKASVPNVQEVVQEAESLAKGKQTKPSLKEKGMELIERMDELSADEEYIKSMMSGESGERKKVLKTAVHKTKPQAVYQVTFQGGNTLFDIMEEEGVSIGDMSKKTREALAKKSVAGLTNMFQSSSAEYLALSAVCMVEHCFVSQELKEDMIYFYIYKDACPAAVTFLKGEDGAVYAKAQYIFDENFDLDSEKGQAVLRMMGAKVKKL